jgi:hypothetical protein
VYRGKHAGRQSPCNCFRLNNRRDPRPGAENAARREPPLRRLRDESLSGCRRRMTLEAWLCLFGSGCALVTQLIIRSHVRAFAAGFVFPLFSASSLEPHRMSEAAADPGWTVRRNCTQFRHIPKSSCHRHIYHSGQFARNLYYRILHCDRSDSVAASDARARRHFQSRFDNDPKATLLRRKDAPGSAGSRSGLPNPSCFSELRRSDSP